MQKSLGILRGIIILVLVLASGSVKQAFTQNNQDIYYQYCVASPDNECFNPVNGAVDTVGRDVSELGGGYRFCLKFDSVNAGIAPVRVMLVLDASGSMCTHYGERDPENCCVIGDSSGFCSKNDIDNKRVEAARTFVDSLRAISPLSEVGVIVFAASPAVLVQPTTLSTDQNVAMIKTAIDSAGCGNVPRRVNTAPPGIPSGTNLGLALKAALVEADRNFESVATKLDRHIILLTDGAWDDVTIAGNSPAGIQQAYQTDPVTAQRALPVIHGVFISDSLTHVTHGYPAEGCAGTGKVEKNNLESIVNATKGIFFGGATPQTIVARFRDLLKSLIKVEAEKLTGMIVTNTTNNQTRTQGKIDTLPSDQPKQVHYTATLENLPLEFGSNILTIKQIIKKTGIELPETTTSTVTIFRTKKWISAVNTADIEYQINCVKDSTTVTIAVTPPQLFVNSAFEVTSTIKLKPRFILDTIQARVFIENSNEQDINTIGLFHLENNLTNATGKAVGTGSVTYSPADALFGLNAINSGSFSFPVGTIAGDFAIEAWVKPVATTTPKELFSNSGFTVGFSSNRILTVTVGGNKVESKIPVDANNWTHVAVSRINDNLILFINGIDATDPLSFTNNVTGILTFTVPDGGVLDEVRISSTPRLRVEANEVLRFEIASLTNTTWISGSKSVQPYLIIPPTQWAAGQLKFQFTSPVHGKMIVNFQHRGTEKGTQWSKNSNSVLVVADLQGPYITRSIFTRGDFDTDTDTFHVFFSEPVRCDSLKKYPPINSFVIYDSNRVKKEGVFTGADFIDNNCPENKLITETRMLVKQMPNGIIPKKDSVALFGITIDTAGNYPDTTKRGPIEYGPGSNFKLKAIPNQIDLPPMTLNGNHMQRLGMPAEYKNTKLILLQTKEKLVEWNRDGRGSNFAEKTVIYDAVGNIVCLDAPIRKSTDDDLMYYIVWNGLNQNNRRVASGSYLFKAVIMYQNDVGRKVPIQTKFNLDWGMKRNVKF